MNNNNMEKIEKIKEEVFHSFFDKRVVDYPVSREGQKVNSYLFIIDGRIQKHYEGIKEKYGFKRNWMDLQSEYIYQCWEAIQKFDTDNGLEDWLKILNRSDDHEVNKLIKYMKQTVGFRLYEYANPDAFRTTTTVDGERVHYTLVIEYESLDNLLSSNIDDGEATSFQLTDENNLFNNTMYSYYVTFFQKWFQEHKDRILTKRQVTFLENLKKCSTKPYLTAGEFEEVTGVKWSDYSRRLRKIEERIEKAWIKENPTKLSRKQVYNSPVMEYFKEYMTILEDDSALLAQNLELTNHLIKGINNEEVEYDVFRVIHDSLKGNELIEFNRLCNSNNHRDIAMSSQSLYKVTALIEQRLHKLEKEQGKLAVEKPLEKGNKKKALKKKKTEILTYDSKGNLIKHEYKLEKEAIKHGNIYYLLPTGLSTQER